MGRKHYHDYAIFDSEDISTDQESRVTSVKNLDKASVHVYWNGTAPIGVLEIEVRNGEKAPWYTLPIGSVINITGNSGYHQIVLNELPFSDIKLKYISTSGTGTMDAKIAMKTVGA